ncbi:MarR family winged helix-turn-helix transcriptional regulator [Mariluticola halotolerans]|uniref:MarR family winged helix-turn-helix transcriptional regulator n=1 Tax=Mariluticola halotolerans TaxID=2909283 RepID=UPI0026E40E7F|nr:MarR family winged helix-turn-helix transcriptional regulator [Mariluticola halotolerans]UJQ93291.1 MarR family winged helix-turn-helix transcriptional regulator [Mariluticola halotolerans]
MIKTKQNAPDPTRDNASAGAEKLQQFVAYGMSPRAAEAAISLDETLATMRRSIARRTLVQQAVNELGLDVDVAHLMVIHTISAAGSEGEVTVGLVAERMDIDPSRASRLTADVVEKGLARRVASQADARRICLELTPRGKAYQEAVYTYKAILFTEALKSWDEDELVELARLFARFSQWVVEGEPTPKKSERVAQIKARLREAETRPD